MSRTRTHPARKAAASGAFDPHATIQRILDEHDVDAQQALLGLLKALLGLYETDCELARQRGGAMSLTLLRALHWGVCWEFNRNLETYESDTAGGDHNDPRFMAKVALLQVLDGQDALCDILEACMKSVGTAPVTDPELECGSLSYQGAIQQLPEPGRPPGGVLN